jgi:hypothetical protein
MIMRCLTGAMAHFTGADRWVWRNGGIFIPREKTKTFGNMFHLYKAILKLSTLILPPNCVSCKLIPQFVPISYSRFEIFHVFLRSDGNYFYKILAGISYLELVTLREKNWVHCKIYRLSSQTKQNKLRDLSPQANYTDRATADCRRC